MLVAYNALLHFLGGSAGDLPRCLEAYRGMAQGPRPDAVTYNTLIAAASGSGNVHVAMQVFSDMVDAGGWEMGWAGVEVGSWWWCCVMLCSWWCCSCGKKAGELLTNPARLA